MSVTDTCPFCPRLCRHVCPVTSATAREAATPTAIATVLRLVGEGKLPAELAAAALELCNGCGACKRHCGVQQDVPALVRAQRDRPVPAALPELLPADGVRTIRVDIGSEAGPGAAATSDALGHATLMVGDDRHVQRVAAHFAGWTVVTGSHAVAEVLSAAAGLAGKYGVRVIMDAPPESGPRFLTCWEGANGVDGQIACCGAREGYERRQPGIAGAMAGEVVRRMGTRKHTCADSHCASWLRAHGGEVEGPRADQSR